MGKVYSKKFNINYIFKNYFDIVVIVFIPLIFVITFFVFVNPMFADLKNKTNTLINNQKQYNDLKYKQSLKIKQMEDSKKVLGALDVEKLNNILPNEKDSENVMVIFEEIAKQSEVDLRSVYANENPEKIGNVRKIDVVSSVSSSDPKKIKKFLENIENNQRLLDVKSFSLQPGSISINVTAYYYEEEIKNN